MQAAETNTPNPSTTERAKMPEDERNVLRLSTTRHSKVQVVEKSTSRPSTSRENDPSLAFEKLIVLPSPAGSKPGGTDTTSEQSTHTDIGIYFEPEIRQNVKFKEVEYSLSGFADYALGHRESGIFSGNLIIVEAKRRFQISSAYGQLLACMGMSYTLGFGSLD